MADQNRNQPNQRNQQSQRSDIDESRGRSGREPASTADDRGIDDSRVRDDVDTELDDEMGVESDLDDMTNTDETDRRRSDR